MIKMFELNYVQIEGMSFVFGANSTLSHSQGFPFWPIFNNI